MVESQGFVIEENGVLALPDGVTPKIQVAEELLPYCPVCGKPMRMNLRVNDTFVEDEGWHKASNAYQDFLISNQNRKVLCLELGVGFNTLGIIKFPFWILANQNPHAVYACLNYGEAACPEEIENRSICIDGDMDQILLKVR